MTIKEAIEFGNMWLQINEDSKNSNTYAFFQMAVKAIKQENTLDKVRAEIAELDAKLCQQFLIEDVDKEVHHAYQECLSIIDKAKNNEKNLIIKQEPRKGHWIEVLGGCKCSNCDMAFSKLKETCADNYCPNCGSDNREDKEK